jgi:hypothetical protein
MMPATALRARPAAVWLRVAIAVLGVVALAGTAAADSHDHHDDHYRHVVHHRPPPRPAWGYDAPTYVQTPPPVVYAPPVYQSPFNLGLSLNIPIR